HRARRAGEDMGDQMRTLFACVLLSSAASALAQDAQPFVVAGVEVNRDSDDFRTESYSAGAGVNRIGYRHSEIDYSAPGFRASGSGASLFAGRKLGAVDLSGELTRSRLDNGQHDWLGWAQASLHPSEPSNLELRYERNWVESSNALTSGITYSMLSAAGDY